MDSIKWGLSERIISGLNPSLLGLHVSHSQREEKVSVSAKRKARRVSLNGDEVLELAYLMAIADEHFFEQLRGRVETDLRERVWSQEELVAQLTHKRQHWLAEEGADEPQSPPALIANKKRGRVLRPLLFTLLLVPPTACRGRPRSCLTIIGTPWIGCGVAGRGRCHA